VYDHQKIDVTQLISSVVPATLTNLGAYYCGYQPMKIRHLWATVTIVTAAAISVLTWKYRPTPGSDTGSSTIGTLSLPIAAAPGKNYYKKLTNDFTILPGSEVVISATGAATGTAAMGMILDPNWDAPGNNPSMIASA
jgi:hypothetical protein